ncbi:MAG TPA: ABC transporter substrate-binding protein [Candidatus Wallbacteria bacterium]|nr:ABC transporter substrate-binding protein [Candidatus Wallbacteria bacterium]
MKLIIIIVVLLVISFCRDLLKLSVDQTAKNSPIIISCSRWPGFMPLVIGVERGIFKKEGVDVEYRYSENIRQSMLDFAADKYDGGCFKLGTVISGCALDRDMKIVLITDFSNGADAIVSAREIKDFKELKGKRVAFRFGSYAEVAVDLLFKNKKMKPSDSVIMNWADETSACELLKKGLVDALFIREPYVSELTGQGYNILASSAEIPNLVPEVVAFRNRTAYTRPEDIKKFIKGWFAACEFLKNKPSESAEILSEHLNLPPSDLSLKSIDLLDHSGNFKAFDKSNADNSLYRCARLYAEYFLKTGILKEPLDIDKLIVSEFIDIK